MRDLRGSSISVGDLAEATGKSVDLVYRWERGEREPGVVELQKVAMRLGIDVTDFFVPPTRNNASPREALLILQGVVERSEALADEIATAKAENLLLREQLEALEQDRPVRSRLDKTNVPSRSSKARVERPGRTG